MPQSRTTSYYSDPWTPYARWQAQGPPPYPVSYSFGTTGKHLCFIETSLTETNTFEGPGDGQRIGVGDLGYQTPSAATSMSANTRLYSVGQNQSNAFPSESGSPADCQRSSSSSDQSDKLPLSPMQGRSKKQRTVPTNGTKVSPYRCPKCPETFTRPEDVKRHDRTRHSPEPFWLCNECGSWQNQVREDKIRAHCVDKHRDKIEYDLDTNKDIYPYRLVDTVGDRDRIDRSPTDGKRTRRRR